MVTKETARKKISELVTRFEEQVESYTKSDYNETLTRRDFIDPFFKALGWDMDNEQGYAEAYSEVIHEDKIRISGAMKAPDYSFRLGGGKRLFFVEAKKPSVFIKEEIPPAYQIRRYGWSAKLPISIITDFQELAIYDKREDLEKYRSIIKHVDIILQLNSELLGTKLQKKSNQLQSRIDFTTEQISKEAYELYELTPEEIKIIEKI